MIYHVWKESERKGNWQYKVIHIYIQHFNQSATMVKLFLGKIPCYYPSNNNIIQPPGKLGFMYKFGIGSDPETFK